jgi:hypothetical protein
MAETGNVFAAYRKIFKEPRWRKGITLEQSGEKVITAIRLEDSREGGEQMGTTFEVDDEDFMPVTALGTQLRREASMK